MSAPAAAAAAAARLFEVRTYSLHLRHVRHFLETVAAQFHLRTQHSPLLGFWTAELGGLNQVTHFWQYDSLSHRASVRARLAGDREWADKFVTPALFPAAQLQENSLCRLLSGTELRLPNSAGVSELQRYSMRGGAATYTEALRHLCAAPVPAGSTLVGCFETLVGPVGDVLLLWHHADADAMLSAGHQLRTSAPYAEIQEHVAAIHTKMLLPHAVSPIQ